MEQYLLKYMCIFPHALNYVIYNTYYKINAAQIAVILDCLGSNYKISLYMFSI